MELSPWGVRVSAGSLRDPEGTALAHPWTDQGAVVAPLANGAHTLHLAVAFCVLNDTYREAQKLGVAIDGVAVQADGDFDESWASTGIRYAIELDSPATREDQERLLDVVDRVAEIPKALRAGAAVERV